MDPISNRDAFESLEQAIRHLTSLDDDYATADNGMGWNKPDSYPGHGLATIPFADWTDQEIRWAYQRGFKYQDQLSSIGFDPFALPKLDLPKISGAGLGRRAPAKPNPLQVAFTGRFEVRFKWGCEGFEDIKGTVKAAGFRFDGYGKFWYGEPTKLNAAVVVLLGRKHGFTIQAEAQRAIEDLLGDVDAEKVVEKASQDAADARVGKLVVEDGQIVLRSEYDPRVVDLVRGKMRWNKDGKVWVAPLAGLSALLADALEALIVNHGFQVAPEIIAAIAPFKGAVDGKIAASAAAEADFQVECPEGLSPFAYQVAGVKYVVDNGGVALIGDEMGLGKTIQALLSFKALKAQKLLVICPASVKYNWGREIAKWVPGTSTVVLRGSAGLNLTDDVLGQIILDFQVRQAGPQQGEHVVSSSNVPAISLFPGQGAVNFGGVHSSSQSGEPVHQFNAGTGDVDAPVAWQALDTALSVQDASQVGSVGLVNGQIQGLPSDATTTDGQPSCSKCMDIAQTATSKSGYFAARKSLARHFQDARSLCPTALAVIRRAAAVIVNYDVLGHWMTLLHSSEFDMAIIDESHAMKNYTSLRSQRVSEILTGRRKIAKGKYETVSDGIAYKLMLTGTAVENRPTEAIPQLQALGMLQSVGGFWPIFNGTLSNTELNRRMRAACYIRRRKADVMKDLPAKLRGSLVVEIDNRGEYGAAEDDVVEYLMGLGDISGATKAQRAEYLVKIAKCRVLAARGKLGAIKEWVEDFFAQNPEKSLVVWAHHQEVQQMLLQTFAAMNPAHVLGSDSSQVRQEQIDRFQGRQTRLMVASLGAAREGITLTAAHHELFCELAWNASRLDQAEDRCHRIGQTENVNIVYLVGADTVDETILGIVDRKRRMAQEVLDGTIEDDDDTSALDQMAQGFLRKVAAR